MLRTGLDHETGETSREGGVETRRETFAAHDSSTTASNGTDALLRSLIVAESDRAQGVGSALVQHAENYAVSREISTVHDQTTTR